MSSNCSSSLMIRVAGTTQSLVVSVHVSRHDVRAEHTSSSVRVSSDQWMKAMLTWLLCRGHCLRSTFFDEIWGLGIPRQRPGTDVLRDGFLQICTTVSLGLEFPSIVPSSASDISGRPLLHPRLTNTLPLPPSSCCERPTFSVDWTALFSSQTMHWNTQSAVLSFAANGLLSSNSGWDFRADTRPFCRHTCGSETCCALRLVRPLLQGNECLIWRRSKQRRVWDLDVTS